MEETADELPVHGGSDVELAQWLIRAEGFVVWIYSMELDAMAVKVSFVYSEKFVYCDGWRR